MDDQGQAVPVLRAAARHPESLHRVEQQGRETQSQREVGVGVLPIVPGSVATLESNWKQGKNLMETLGINEVAVHLSRLVFKEDPLKQKAVDMRKQKLRNFKQAGCLKDSEISRWLGTGQ